MTISKKRYILLIDSLVGTKIHLSGNSGSEHPHSGKFKPMLPSSLEASLPIMSQPVLGEGLFFFPPFGGRVTV